MYWEGAVVGVGVAEGDGVSNPSGTAAAIEALLRRAAAGAAIAVGASLSSRVRSLSSSAIGSLSFDSVTTARLR